MISLEVAKNCSSQNAMADRILKVISFYGFVPFEEAPIGEQAVVSGRVFRFDPKNIRFLRREERRLIGAMRTCALRGLGDGRMPAFLFKFTPEIHEGNPAMALELHVIGIKTAAAEALLITIADAIAKELGIERRFIALNGVGVGESADRYTREVASFLRKHNEHLSSAQRERIESEPLEILLALNARAHPILSRAPSGMDYLSEDERRHFWDVLEYLELLNKSYELNQCLVGSHDCWAHTLFEMSYPIETEGGEGRAPFALGGRYDTLATNSLGVGATAACVTLTFELKVVPTIKKKPKPVAFLAHLGLEAKRRSIPALEVLREANVPVYHSLAYDQLAPQMAMVKNIRVAWLLLIGQKEATAGEVAVRNIKTNVQDAVPLPELIGYLKRKHIVS